MQIERATIFGNGKRNREVFKSTLQADLKAVFEGIVDSNLDPQEIADMFTTAGLVLPPMTLQSLLARRFVAQGKTAGIRG